MELINSLENRRILLKWTTKKITIEKEGFPIFLMSLITASLPFTKNILMPVAKNVFLTFRLLAGMSATDAAI